MSFPASERMIHGLTPKPHQGERRCGAYHAVWARLQELDEQVPEARPGARYFPHRRSADLESIGDIAERLEALTEAEIAELEILWAYRVKADYKPDDVVAAEARECIRASDRIVQRLSGGEEME